MNIKSAKSASEFVNIIETDSKGRVTKSLVPGHKGKTYQVSIKRTRNVMTCSCVGLDGFACQGNKNNICYHTLASLLASCNRSVPKVKISFCKNKSDAEALINLGGKCFPFRSVQSGKEIWVVAQLIENDLLIC